MLKLLNNWAWFICKVQHWFEKISSIINIMREVVEGTWYTENIYSDVNEHIVLDMVAIIVFFSFDIQQMFVRLCQMMNVTLSCITINILNRNIQQKIIDDNDNTNELFIPWAGRLFRLPPLFPKRIDIDLWYQSLDHSNIFTFGKKRKKHILFNCSIRTTYKIWILFSNRSSETISSQIPKWIHISKWFSVW